MEGNKTQPPPLSDNKPYSLHPQALGPLWVLGISTLTFSPTVLVLMTLKPEVHLPLGTHGTCWEVGSGEQGWHTTGFSRG